MFKDRIEAGNLLATQLSKYKSDQGLVFAIPKGGVPLAYVVAKELGFPMEIVFTKKIGHPNNKEYAIGAASLNDYFVIPHYDVSEEYIQEELKVVREKLRNMQDKFLDDHKPEILDGKTVIIVDDGMATGNTVLSTINLIKKKNPAKIIVAIPVASQSAVQMVTKEADEVIVLKTPPDFSGVGVYYENFNDVSEQEVLLYLEKLRELKMLH
ncbi:phosphoribosyltransferase [Daejeonella sp.]|jgi:predicted phosphoribosyltransferase|uniref:phosphoribosyltransferase n=1 Tax=Daejeonella sp. TaxID=2805397 RepID=UPI0037BEB439